MNEEGMELGPDDVGNLGDAAPEDDDPGTPPEDTDRVKDGPENAPVGAPMKTTDDVHTKYADPEPENDSEGTDGTGTPESTEDAEEPENGAEEGTEGE
ncbi:MAG TPA: hypothetical protein VJQ25_00775 [Nitrospira sp.]|nr:hypothetical protein [Nitrospira sp.]